MPCSYVIDRKRRVILTTFSGQVTGAEIKAMQDRLQSDADFSAELNSLIDASEATELMMDINEMRLITSRSQLAGSARRAFVANATIVVAVGRMLDSYRQIAGGKEQSRIFPDRAAAQEWLGL